ncbi:hypothetical protein KJ819_00770 [Patescibacteria group bacterium]|nr:hypothetical protein [Patescibacteria group bacterium]MBU1500664.1 hypothetical protein [Patescibacteria group bacterium]MBU2080383.1 hypothetical protein [Patescibacteria group bacterium]MBU2124205.1 hypothetical protein [Patescibacteria group bacterium]MBU2194344.1 hypothetical protein [Patescibacteria group bacterium]
MDTSAALHALACEESGLDIPAGIFAGKESVGMKFPLKEDENRFGEFLAAHWEAAKLRFFENRDDFLSHALFVQGALRSAQILVSRGWGIAIVSDVKRLDEGLLRHWLHQQKFPNTDASRILTRGQEPKAGWQSCCDVVVDNELGQLLPLAKESGLRLVHFLPDPKSVGGQRKLETSLHPSIASLRGWEEALPFILQFEEALA